MPSPNEEFDEFILVDDSEPRPGHVVRPSGIVEILKPVARPEEPAKAEPAVVASVPRTVPSSPSARPTAHGLSWFHRSLVIGGAIAIVVITFLGGVFFGSNNPPAKPTVESADTAANPSDTVAGPRDEALNDRPETMWNDFDPSGLVPDEDSASTSDEPATDRSVVKRKHARPRRRLAYRRHVLFAADRPRRQPLRPQLWVSDFIPTTLVIFVENGEVKTRTEPWLNPIFKKGRPSSN